MGPEPSPVWDLAKQMGIDNGVFNLPQPTETKAPWDFEPLEAMSQRAADAGIDIQVIEERPPMDKIRLAAPGRDEQIEHVKTLLRNMGKLDIPVWCWSWRTHFSVIRTGRARLRGGSEGTAFVKSQLAGHLEGDPTAERAPAVSQAELWENVEYFLGEVVPVAEEADVKLAIHPDDPPIDDDIAGTGRIMISRKAYDRLLDLYPSSHHGICLGQGNFSAAGEDIPDTIRHFGDDIEFVHFRDVRGTADNFYETWHDNGQTDMGAAMDAYSDIGFEGPIRPDHYPTVTAGGGDGTFKGRIHAAGYLQGLIEQTASVSW